MIEANPLNWPQGWPRARQQEYSRLAKYSFARARNECLAELKRLGATDIIMSSNLKLRQDGLPYSGQRQPDDVGIAVYFKLDGQDQCIPCDKWTTIEQNLRAIAKTIEALRGIERWGAKEMVNAAFRGFKALPESIIMGAGSSKTWYEILEVETDASEEVVKDAHRTMLKKHHPDMGGDPAQFNIIQNAYNQYRSQL